MKKYTKVVYPGTFDPITNGHLDIIKRARNIFENVIVAVSDSEGKNPYFTLENRVNMIKKATQDLSGVSVIGFNSLLVDFAKENDTRIIIRGLRAVSDFEFELQLGYANASLWAEIETIYLMPNLQNAFISSSVVRSILKYSGDVSHLVPKEVFPCMKDFTCT